MNGTERRERIIEILRGNERPLSGTGLANEFGVSRQVIVQDVALLRTAGKQIISTNRGYILVESDHPIRVFKVSHTDEEIEDELTTIVDQGGTVLDVFVWHRTYGKISGPLNIRSRRDVKDFMERLAAGISTPLKNVTSGYHYHTIEAEDEETFDAIARELQAKGYLLPMDEGEEKACASDIDYCEPGTKVGEA